MAIRKNETSPSQSSAAKKVLDALRALRSQITGYKAPRTADDFKKLTPTAVLTDSFLESVAVAVEASGDLRAASKVDPAQLRDAIRYSNAFGAVADELEAMAHAVRFTIATRRSEAGGNALRVYDLAKGLARHRDSELSSNVNDMKQSLGRKGRRRSTSPDPALA